MATKNESTPAKPLRIHPRATRESFTMRRVIGTTALPESLTWWDAAPPAPPERLAEPLIERQEVTLLSGRKIVLIRREEFDHKLGRRRKQFFLQEGGAVISEADISIDEWPLFGSDRLEDAERVVVAEGLKARRALIKEGIPAVATLSPSVSDAALEPIADREVVVWPDNDARGVRIMVGLASKLQQRGTDVRMVRWVDGPHHGDAADFTGNLIDAIEDAKGIDPLLLDSIAKLSPVKATPAPLMLRSRRKVWMNRIGGSSDE